MFKNKTEERIIEIVSEDKEAKNSLHNLTMQTTPNNYLESVKMTKYNTILQNKASSSFLMVQFRQTRWELDQMCHIGSCFDTNWMINRAVQPALRHLAVVRSSVESDWLWGPREQMGQGQQSWTKRLSVSPWFCIKISLPCSSVLKSDYTHTQKEVALFKAELLGLVLHGKLSPPLAPPS